MVKNKETVFITGASGFVGKFLLERLIKDDRLKLILNCRNPEESIELRGHECSNMDLSNERSIASFFEKYHPAEFDKDKIENLVFYMDRSEFMAGLYALI